MKAKVNVLAKPHPYIFFALQLVMVKKGIEMSLQGQVV